MAPLSPHGVVVDDAQGLHSEASSATQGDNHKLVVLEILDPESTPLACFATHT